MERFFGIPRLMRIGRIITPIATTAPAPNKVEKIAVVTMDKSTQMITGLSPPSSTALRISASAIPVCKSTRPNQAPNTTLTMTLPQPSGPDWKTLVIASTKLISVTPGYAAIKSGLVANVFPSSGSAVHNTPMMSIPIIRLPPRTAYTARPMNVISSRIPITYSITFPPHSLPIIITFSKQNPILPR